MDIGRQGAQGAVKEEPALASPPRTGRSLSVRFSARDLLTTASFAVILIVITSVIGLLGVISPLTWLLVLPLQALTSGVTVLLFLARVRHAGMFTLFAAVVALFFLLTGNTLLSSLGIVLLGVIAELLLWAGRYRSRWAAIWAYTVFSLSFATPVLPVLLDRDGYFQSSSWAQMGADYINVAKTLMTGPVLGLAVGVILVAGFLGGLLGSAILRKHFVRAGLA